MPNSIILNSLKQSFALIWKNKLLFVLLFILQIVFIILFSSLSVVYLTKMLGNAKTISDYISQLQLDDAAIASNILQQKSILGDDPLTISRNLDAIIRNFRLYLFYTFILLVFSVSAFWAITIRLIHQYNFKHLIDIFKRNFVILILYLGLIFWFFSLIADISFIGSTVKSELMTKFLPFLIFSLILLYFMFISLSLSHNINLRNIFQETLRIGIKKIHYVVGVYFINLIFFLLPLTLLAYFIERNAVILFLSLILIIFSFIFGKIFMINVVQKLENL